jgi:chromosome segregation ATPase
MTSTSTTSTSPFIWLKDLCTHFDWLHAGSQSLAEGRPLSPPDSIPDHAIGEIVRSLLRVDEMLRAHRDETARLRNELEARERELRLAAADAEGARRETADLREAFDHTRRTLEDRQRGWDEMEAKWHQDRMVMEQRASALDQRVRALTERLKDHAQTLTAVAADLVNAAE